jgi:hypothetical protein
MLPLWVQYVQALGPAAAALAAAIIVYSIQRRQWKTADAKLRLDLFERRLRVYETIQAALLRVIRDGRGNLEMLRDYDAGTQEAEFLFGDGVVEYIRSIRNMIIQTEYLTENWNNQQSDKRLAMIHEKHNILRYMNDEFGSGLAKRFGRYMSFHQIAS